ncbi:MAG: hypothetical protein J6B04_03145, partial [Clostridia bacterium]|nr:hypothetical protein [Clostridia bacterium]
MIKLRLHGLFEDIEKVINLFTHARRPGRLYRILYPRKRERIYFFRRRRMAPTRKVRVFPNA